jgi:hypothetical protein
MNENKGKVCPVHAMEAYRKCGSTAPLILHLGSPSGQLHAMAILLPGKKPLQYPLNSKLGGPQNQSGRFGEEKHLLLLPASEAWLIQPVT